MLVSKLLCGDGVWGWDVTVQPSICIHSLIIFVNTHTH